MYTDSHRDAFCGGKLLTRLRKKVFQYRSVRLARIAFQACAFIRLRSRVSLSRATARCLAVAAKPRRRTTTRPSLRLESTTSRN
jgi:hypothetical protein